MLSMYIGRAPSFETTDLDHSTPNLDQITEYDSPFVSSLHAYSLTVRQQSF